MKRRQFLSLGLTSIPLLAMAPAFSAPATLPSGQHPTLLAFLDTLIPADETPSASQLGLETSLIHHAQSIENYMALLTMGCQWLDQQSQASHHVFFWQLAESLRQPIVGLAETSPTGSIPKQLFDHVKSDLFHFYYSHPTILPSLGLLGAPQPFGYLDYAGPPAKKTV
jgi:hypothetical protein